MKYVISGTLLFSSVVYAGSIDQVQSFALVNGFTASSRVLNAIDFASRAYKINPIELAAIAIIETGLGRYERINVNKNGTIDVGLFQINSINRLRCLEYNLDTPEGSALCAAKLLYKLRKRHPSDYIGYYHSGNPEKQAIYMAKFDQLAMVN